MKKVLLGTTALVAAGFVASAASADEMMAEPISASVGGHYFVALGAVSGDDGAGEPLENAQSTSLAQDLRIVLSGSTTLDNGMTVSLTAKMDSSKNTPNAAHSHAGGGGPQGVTTNDTGNAHWDERFVTIGGAFGSLQLGSVESARQQTTTFAPSAAGMMGINTPYFTFTTAIARYDDGIGAEDALKLVYFTPAMNGFSVGVSYAPQDSGGAQYGGNSSGDAGEYKNHIGVGATFSQDFAGGSVSLSAGYETYDAEVPSGMSCDDLQTGMYRLDDKLAAINKAADGDAAKALELAIEAGGGNTADNPLLSAPNTLEVLDGTNNATVSSFAMPGVPISGNCEPETVQFGLSMGFGDFSFGGGWQESDTSDTTKASVMDVGVGWSSGPISLAAMYGQANAEAAGGDAEVTRYGVNGSYALGAGVDVQAQLDFGEVDGPGPKDPTTDYDWVQFMIGTSVNF